MTRFFSLPLAAMLTALAFSGQALAHAHLDATTPADNVEVSAPAEIALDFTEALELPFSSIELSDENGDRVELGDAALESDDMTLVAPVDGELEPGRYVVEWQVLSVDGHRTEGRYEFVVTP